MNYARKLALLLFAIWAISVMFVVLVTLQRSDRSMTELRGGLILRHLMGLPRRLIEQPHSLPSSMSSRSKHDDSLPAVANGSTSKKKYTPPTLAKNATASVHSGIKLASNTLKHVVVTQQASYWNYHLEITGRAPKPHSFGLSLQQRWVIDLPGIWRVEGDNSHHFATGPVQKVVVGQHPDHLRIVFWLRKQLQSPQLTFESEKLTVKFAG